MAVYNASAPGGSAAKASAALEGYTITETANWSGTPPQSSTVYYKDEAKTKATFREINGVRYSIPGDYARVEADGTVTMLGRGSVSINTGGEKVYPEEVEGALKAHPAVFDALVVGVPDARWGSAVAAVVQTRDAQRPTLEELRAALAPLVASYKHPRQIWFVEEIKRSPAGKPDYRWARAQTEQREPDCVVDAGRDEGSANAHADKEATPGADEVGAAAVDATTPRVTGVEAGAAEVTAVAARAGAAEVTAAEASADTPATAGTTIAADGRGAGAGVLEDAVTDGAGAETRSES